jgi:hypothetical protein
MTSRAAYRIAAMMMGATLWLAVPGSATVVPWEWDGPRDGPRDGPITLADLWSVPILWLDHTDLGDA